MYPWFCLRSKPAQEAVAVVNLERQRYPVFLPLLKSRLRYRRKYQWITKPLFPGYLFAQFDPEEHSRSVRSTRGVASIVSFGERPALVPLPVIEELRVRCVDGVIEWKDDSLRPGDPVSIMDGPYQGMQALFDRKTRSTRRVIILLNIMASVAQVEIDRDLLAKT